MIFNQAPTCRLRRWTGWLVIAWLAFGCVSPAPAPRDPPARPFAEAEAIFHRDPRWLGADAALTIPLGGERILWLFGDTFIATSDRHVRAESLMVSNTVAIQSGMDPLSARMTFHWRRGRDRLPAAFFSDPDPGRRKFWPGHGVRLARGPLVIFLYAIAATPGQGLGFASAGHAIAVIDNPDMSPDQWNPRIVEVASSRFDAVPATAVLQEGDYVVALAIRQQGTHAGMLVRYPAARLAQGDAGHAEWWAGTGRGWVPEALIGPDGPAVVIDDAGAECSIHRDARTGTYLHVASYGFGASTIGVRTAPALVGPWSAPREVYRPPESDGPRPFVYAAKGHPELVAKNRPGLQVTYAANSFEFGDLVTPTGERRRYWPRVVTVDVDGDGEERDLQGRASGK